MADFRYAQFCALARSAEIVGERWTLLIFRELLLGAKRFSDLRDRLVGISTSVLAERLARLQAEGLIQASVMPPPAASTVYELTADGRALESAVRELIRWGARRMLPPRANERFEPEWIRLALWACARRSSTPSIHYRLRITGDSDFVLDVAGGPAGTIVRTSSESDPVDLTITGDALAILALASGVLSPEAALASGKLEIEGQPSALESLATLFDVDLSGHPAPQTS